MEVAVKLIITVLFITLIALTIVFFGIFGIAPLTRLVNKVDKGDVATTVVTEAGTETKTDIITTEEGFQELQEDVRVFVPEASPVTQEGQVVTQTGESVKLDVEPGSPDAPQQSNPISEESLPKEAIKLRVSETGFSPNTFTVKSGAAVTLSLTTADDRSHIFKFNDPNLSAIAIGVGTSKTRAITFNAPAKGEYSFFCDVPGHANRGETGVMVVE